MKVLVRIIIVLTLAISLDACRSQKGTLKTDKKESERSSEQHKRSEHVLSVARKFMGTPWKLGGESKSGIDCSGLVYISYKEVGVQLPRRSIEQAAAGKEIVLSKAEPGDLIFFAFSEVDKKGINHVGIVSKIDSDNTLYFLHTSRKKGVMESSLGEPYFKKAFVKVVRP